MDFSDFQETLASAAEAQRWRPIGEMLARKLYARVMGGTEDRIGNGGKREKFQVEGIGVDAYLVLLGDFIATPNQTPADLFAAIKVVHGRQLKEREAAVRPHHKGWRDMTEAERQSYQATIARVKAKMADDLAQLHAEGKIPVTKVAGFSSVGSLLAGQTLKTGLDDLQLSAQLEQEPGPAISTDSDDLEWEDAA